MVITCIFKRSAVNVAGAILVLGHAVSRFGDAEYPCFVSVPLKHVISRSCIEIKAFLSAVLANRAEHITS